MPDNKKIRDIEASGDATRLKIYYEDGTDSIISIDEYKADKSKYTPGSMITVDDPKESTSTDPAVSLKKPKTVADYTVDIPAKFEKFFEVKPGKGKKGRINTPATATIKEREAFRDWANENNIYDNAIQGNTKGQSDIFYGGLTPEDFEYEFYKGYYGKEAADEQLKIDGGKQHMRNMYFTRLGLNKYADQNANTDIYNDPKFKKDFLEAYKKEVPQEFRQLFDENDIEKFGYDHLDALFKQTPERKLDSSDTEEPCPDPEFMVKDADGNCNCKGNMVLNPETGKCEEPAVDANKQPEDPGKFFAPDRLNVAAAWSDQIEARYPRLSKVDLDPGDVAYQDYATQVANQQAGTDKLLEFIENTTGGGLGAAAAVGASAQSLQNIANTIAQTQAANVNTFNQYDARRAGIENQERTGNEAALTRYVDQVNAVNQNVEDEEDLKRANITKMINKMWSNEANVSALEQAYPNAPKKDRYNASDFTEGVGRNAYLAAQGFDSYVPMNNPQLGNQIDLAAQVEALEKRNFNREDAINLITAQSKMANAARRTSPRTGRKKDGGSTTFGVFLQGGIFE